MKKRILAISLTLLFAAGWAGAATQEAASRTPAFTVGEKFTFLIAWSGIPVGRATIAVEELTTFEGHEVYKIVLRAETNAILSTIFRVDDTFASYMDKDKLISRHYEATIREGRYKKDLVVNYDFRKSIAVYKNLRDGSVKTCPVEKDVRDPICAAYYLRTLPLKAGDEIKITVNLCENNYEVNGTIEKESVLKLSKLGTFEAFLIRPYVMLRGKRQKRGKAWGYFSAGKKRLPLYAAIKVLEIPWIGNVTATLKKVEPSAQPHR